MKILKALLLPVIISSITWNNCNSMESIKDNCINNNINNETPEKDMLGFIFEDDDSDYEDKKSQNNNNQTIRNINNLNKINDKRDIDTNNKLYNNDEEQYKHIFDKKYNEKYYCEVYNKCYKKYSNKAEYRSVINEIRDLWHEIYSLYCESEGDMLYDVLFYDMISYEDEFLREKFVIGDRIKVMNCSELMKYAKLFDSFPFENKFNNKLLANNNVENLSKYMSIHKGNDEISYLQFIHYMLNNTAKLEEQILEMIYHDQLNSSNYMILKEYPRIIQGIIDGLKHVTNIATERCLIQYKGTSHEDLLGGRDIPINESWNKNYHMNKMYFKLKPQSKIEIWTKTQKLINNFNTLHDTIINDLNEIIKNIKDYKIPNDLIVCKFFHHNLFYDIIPDASHEKYCTFLDKYLQQLVVFFTKFEKKINKIVRISITHSSKNDLVEELFSIADKIFTYVKNSSNILKCFEKRFPGNDLLSFKRCRDMIDNFYKSYAIFASDCYNKGKGIILIDDKD